MPKEETENVDQRREALTTAKQSSRIEKKAHSAEKQAHQEEAKVLAAREKELREQKKVLAQRKAASKKIYKQRMKTVRASLPPLSERFDTTYLWMLFFAPFATFVAKNLAAGVEFSSSIDFFHLPNIVSSIILGYVASHRFIFIQISPGCANGLAVGLAGTMSWFSTWIMAVHKLYDTEKAADAFLALFYGFADALLGISLGITLAEIVRIIFPSTAAKVVVNEDGTEVQVVSTSRSLGTSESRRSLNPTPPQTAPAQPAEVERPGTSTRKTAGRRRRSGRIGAIMEFANKLENKQKASEARKRAKEAKRAAKQKSQTSSSDELVEVVSHPGEGKAFTQVDHSGNAIGSDSPPFTDSADLEPWPRRKIPKTTIIHLAIIIGLLSCSVLLVEFDDFEKKVAEGSWSVYFAQLGLSILASYLRYILCRFLNRTVPIGTLLVNALAVSLMVYADVNMRDDTTAKNLTDLGKVIMNGAAPALSTLSAFGQELRELSPIGSLVYGAGSVVGGVALVEILKGVF